MKKHVYLLFLVCICLLFIQPVVIQTIVQLKTIKIQLLKKSGRPSERLVTHDSCNIDRTKGHQCLHVHEITEAEGTQDAEADAEYDSAFKEAICGVQETVTCINEYMEEVRYEIEALESQ